MIKEKIKEMQISLIELFSIITFLTFTYSLLVKYSFYSTLGMKWLINTLTPQFIILNSIKIILTTIFSIIIGLCINYLCNTIEKIHYSINTILIILFTYIIFVIYKLKFRTSETIDLTSLYLGDFVVIIFTLFLVIYLNFVVKFIFFLKKYRNYDSDCYNIPFTKLRVKKPQLLSVFVVIQLTFIITAFVYAPIFKGRDDANKILNNKEKLLNSIIIKNSNQNWYLIDMNGDKAYLISEKENNIKIIEYKDIEYIKQIPKES